MSEIILLLKHGFADGAHARWRSLHEITVVASFICKYGNEIAEKYLLHDKIESYKSAKQLNDYHKGLNYEPISQVELISLTKDKDRLLERFGKSFYSDYGWAASVLQNNKPKFCDIEYKMGLDYLRPLYRLASSNVHATPKGILFRLGIENNNSDILLAGPSNYGFIDPAQGAVFSLCYLDSLLLTYKTTIDHIIFGKILIKLRTEIVNEFVHAQDEIMQRVKLP